MLLRCGVILSIYGAAVVETSAPPIPGTVPIQWLILVAIGVTWTFSPIEATLWGVIIGFVADATAGGRMGLDVLTFSTLACVLASLRQRWEWRSLLSFALMAWATAGGLLLAPIGVRCLEGELDGAHIHAVGGIGSAAATAVVAVVIAAAGRALGTPFQLFAPERV